MTDMDDAFDEIYRSILNDHIEVSKPLTLGILRKAKAEGLRRGADLATSDEGCGDIDFIRFKLILEAQDLEKTSTD